MQALADVNLESSEPRQWPGNLFVARWNVVVPVAEIECEAEKWNARRRASIEARAQRFEYSMDKSTNSPGTTFIPAGRLTRMGSPTSTRVPSGDKRAGLIGSRDPPTFRIWLLPTWRF